MKNFENKIIKKYKERLHTKKFANICFNCYFANSWLEEQFVERVYPFIQDDKDNKETSFDFYAVSDTNLYDKIQEKVNGCEIINQVASYCTKESGTVRIKKYKLDQVIVILSERETAFWILDGENVIYIGNDDCEQHFYREFFILFEHILLKRCVEQGALLVHAAAVAKDNKATIMVGNKRSGKTTTFFELCKKGGFSPLSVDKVLLVKENEGISVYGVPTRLRVLAGTLSKYNELLSLIPEKYRKSPDEELWKGESDSKVEMELREFEFFVTRKFVIKAALDNIVFNSIDFKNQNIELTTGCLNDNMLILNGNIYSPENPEEDWWSEIGLVMKKEITNLCNDIVKDLTKLNMIKYKTKNNFAPLIEELASV